MMSGLPLKLQKLRDQAAEARAERCWPGNEIRKLETRCDFKEGTYWMAEQLLPLLKEARAVLGSCMRYEMTSTLYAETEATVAKLDAALARYREGE